MSSIEKILDGRKLADELNSDLKKKISQVVNQVGIRPKLATVMVGEDPASKIYVNIKHKTSAQVGIDSLMVNLKISTSKKELIKKLKELNNDNSIHGILLQIPLPIHLKEFTSEFLECVSPIKDVDGFHPYNRGKLFDYDESNAACTPKGIIALLEHNNVEIKGKNVTIINRSNLVGKPLIFMLLKRNATVSICHTSTKDIDSYIKNADILVVAVGRPNFITKEKIKDGVVIIDVGTNRIGGKLCGDVDFDNVIDKCSKITPVPGGVGPMTITSLLQNTLECFERQQQ